MWAKSSKLNYSKQEELWNCITHGIGVILSVVALILMISSSLKSESNIALISTSVFGLSLIFMYSASTVYHIVQNPNVKLKWKKIDHLAIYFLIAGTYTPMCLLGLKGTWGWWIFGIIWALVILGFVFKFSPIQKNEKLSLILYALMGWLVVVAVKPLVDNLPTEALWLVALGGFFYTFGILFYVKEQIPYNHAIWHIFVLLGSIMHFLCVFLYLIPTA